MTSTERQPRSPARRGTTEPGSLGPRSRHRAASWQAVLAEGEPREQSATSGTRPTVREGASVPRKAMRRPEVASGGPTMCDVQRPSASRAASDSLGSRAPGLVPRGSPVHASIASAASSEPGRPVHHLVRIAIEAGRRRARGPDRRTPASRVTRKAARAIPSSPKWSPSRRAPRRTGTDVAVPVDERHSGVSPSRSSQARRAPRSSPRPPRRDLLTGHSSPSCGCQGQRSPSNAASASATIAAIACSARSTLHSSPASGSCSLARKSSDTAGRAVQHLFTSVGSTTGHRGRTIASPTGRAVDAAA